MVPPSAAFSLPSLRDSAPVNAPLSYPKSSLSRRLSGIAAQLMVKKGFWHLRLLLCSKAATNSFPVPVSPVIRMLLSVDASLKRRPLSSLIEALSPMIPLDSARCCDEEALAALRSPDEPFRHLLT